jgi:hypothetical protein
MEEQPQQPQEQAYYVPEEQRRTPAQRAMQLKVFALSMLGAGGVDLLIHQGWPGLAIGTIAAFFLAQKSPDIKEALMEELPIAEVKELFTSHEPGSRSLKDRLLGIHYDDEQPQVKEADLSEEGAPEALPPTESESDEKLPQAPLFREMCHLIRPNRLVLCWTLRGPLYGAITDLLSMVIIGLPGRGKTTALMYYVAMLLAAGAEVYVWDPHSSMNELAGIARLHYSDDLEEMSESVADLLNELEERRLLWKTSKQVRRPLLLLVDELPVIGQYAMKHNKAMLDLIEKFVLEARKWNCYFIGAGQSTDAEILPTRVTENLSSRIAFFCSDRRARMAGLDEKSIKQLLPLLKPDTVKGRMIFDCSRIGEPVLGAIPAITIHDLQAFLGLPRQKQPVDMSVSRVSSVGSAGNVPGNSRETAPEAEPEKVIRDVFPVSRGAAETGAVSEQRRIPPVSQETLEHIRRMKAKGFSDREIASLVGLSGRKYALYRECVAYLAQGKGA